MKRKLMIVVSVILLLVISVGLIAFRGDRITRFTEHIANFIDDLIPDKNTDEGEQKGLIVVGANTEPGYGKIIESDC